MRQGMYCHACDKDFLVDTDLGKDGNHIFNCPYCGHEHCRIVRNGEITDARWDSRNVTWQDSTSIGTSVYTYNTNSYLAQSWAQTSTATSYY